jgi:hypothetical protein
VPIPAALLHGKASRPSEQYRNVCFAFLPFVASGERIFVYFIKLTKKGLLKNVAGTYRPDHTVSLPDGGETVSFSWTPSTGATA